MYPETDQDAHREPDSSGEKAAPLPSRDTDTRKGSRLFMIRRPSLPTFYDLYQTVIAIIGMVGVNLLLFGMTWPRAIGYATVTVVAYWAGQGLVSLFQKSAKTSVD